jgi:hypothetical protein
MAKELRIMLIEELRQFKGFENYSDEQAANTIQSIVSLNQLFYELILKSNSNEFEFNTPQKINNSSNYLLSIIL